MICWVNVVQCYVFMVNAVLFNVLKPIVLKVNLNEHLQVMTKYIFNNTYPIVFNCTAIISVTTRDKNPYLSTKSNITLFISAIIETETVHLPRYVIFSQVTLLIKKKNATVTECTGMWCNSYLLKSSLL